MYILINKPEGPTSHNIIDQLRRITGIRKIGHAGTLDPFANGLLLVAIGRESTKTISKFVGLNKTYEATLKLGYTSNTYDNEGELIKIENDNEISEEVVKKVVNSFTGEKDQIPPMFSAKKVQGKKLYDLARKGIEIERKPSRIHIYNIEVTEFKKDILKIKIECSSGTYIRSLAHDIGQKLGTGAYLEKLKRTKIGDHDIKDSVEVKDLNPDNWQTYCFGI